MNEERFQICIMCLWELDAQIKAKSKFPEGDAIVKDIIAEIKKAIRQDLKWQNFIAIRGKMPFAPSVSKVCIWCPYALEHLVLAESADVLWS